MGIADNKERVNRVISLAAQGYSQRQIGDQLGLGKSTINRILSDRDVKVAIAAKAEEITNMVSAIVPIAGDDDVAEDYNKVVEEIEEVKVIPLAQAEYVESAINVKKIFIDKALRNVTIANKLEALTDRLTDKASTILDKQDRNEIAAAQAFTALDRLTRVIKSTTASQVEISRLSLSLIEVGLQTGEIAKFMSEQES